MRMPLRIFKAADRSMEPAIKGGEYLIATGWFGKLKPGDIVVLEHPARRIKIVKRISALSDNSVYVLGDNREMSEDSRSFGYVDRAAVAGKVICII